MGRKLLKELGDNKSIKKEFRANFKAGGVKYYLCYKLVDIQLYATAHAADLRKQHTKGDK